MQLFIDTANLEEVRAAKAWGILDGVTTNPSLIKKEVERLKAAGQPTDLQAHINALLAAAGTGVPVSLEVTATDAKTMVEQGLSLHRRCNSVAGNVTVKIPVNTYEKNGFEGIKAIKALEDASIPVNATLIFTPEQALLAARAGATYVSPFAGRIDDHIRDQASITYQKDDYFPAEGWAAEDDEGNEDTLDDNGIISGIDLLAKTAELFEKHDVDCNIIAASLRNPRQVREAALAGATIATVPFNVLRAMIMHEKTKEGMEQFTKDVVPAYESFINGQQATTPQPPPTTTPPAQPQAPSAYDLARRQ